MADKPVRVRFAPSPTGKLHVGGGVSAPDAAAAAGSAPTKAEFDAVVALVNELKAKLAGK